MENLCKTHGVYMILNKITNERYIGSTTNNFSRRFSEHRYKICSDKKTAYANPLLAESWNKYGKDAFAFIVLETIDDKDKRFVQEREQYWLDYFKSMGIPVFNRCPNTSSNRGLIMPEEANQIRIEKTKIAKANWTPEFKEAFSKKLKGTWTPKRRKVWSIRVKKAWRENRDRMARNGKTYGPYTFISPEGESYTSENLTDFCKPRNLDCSAMLKVHLGKRKSHKGWTSG